MKINVIDNSYHWVIPVNGRGAVSLHIPLTKATRHLDAYEERQQLKRYLKGLNK